MTGLTTLNIPDTVTTIGIDAFWNCTALNSVTIPDSVKTIGMGAFSDCSNLTTISLTNSVTSFEIGAFSRCKKLLRINFDGTKSEWKNIYKKSQWNAGTGEYVILCSDGNLEKYQ